MALSEVVAFAHRLIKKSKKYHLAIDATLGNGHDTLELAKSFEKVIAFDIQDLAIKRSKKRLINYQNVTLIKGSNVEIKNYLEAPIDFAIYNLGFLPGSNHKISTNPADTIASLSELLPLLDKSGIIIIVCYLRHDHGLEFNSILNFLQTSKIKHQVYDQFEHDRIVLIEK
jgi:hypothetical protein